MWARNSSTNSCIGGTTGAMASPARQNVCVTIAAVCSPSRSNIVPHAIERLEAARRELVLLRFQCALGAEDDVVFTSATPRW
jgi:hypothetical protein